jgi:hypothetical protein
MASRKPRVKKPEPIIKKFIMVSQAVYLNQYVVHANSQEEAEAIWMTIKDNEEEGDMICVQQLMDEQVIDCKEAN